MGRSIGLFWIYLLFWKNLKSELAPLEDRSQFRLSLTAPEGSSYEYMDQYIDKLSQFLLESVPKKTLYLVLPPLLLLAQVL